MEVVVNQGSILETEVDAIVNAANAGGTMGGGVAAAIRKAGGQQVEDEAVSAAPIALGDAVLTAAGALPFRAVIHAPTMQGPAEQSTPELVYRATAAAVHAANEAGLGSIAVPGMGTGIGGVNLDEAAASMVAALRDAAAGSVTMVLLTDIDEAMIAAWQKALSRGEHVGIR